MILSTLRPPYSRQINNSQLHQLNDSDSSLELTGTFTTSEEVRITPAMAGAVSAPRDAGAAGAAGGGTTDTAPRDAAVAAAAGGAVGTGGAVGLSRPAAGGAGEAKPSGGDANVDDRYAVVHSLLYSRTCDGFVKWLCIDEAAFYFHSVSVHAISCYNQ